MVELNNGLGGIAVQHREVQEKESDNILLYFKNRVTYLSGGVDSGFRHVDSSEAEPHLYHMKSIRTNLSLVQLPVWRDRLNSGDIFILVCGEDKVWLWIGSDANASLVRVCRHFSWEVPPEIGGFDLPIV